MQTNRNGIKANNSSLIQRIKSLFQGNVVSGPTHTHFYHPSVTIRKSDLSIDKQASFDQLFSDLFDKVQPLRN
jgi:hypothetical protein